MPSRSAPALDISYLTHFAITSLVTFGELCILLYHEVLKFRGRVSIFVSFLSAILFVLAQFCQSCQSFLINTILHSILPFCTGEIAWFGIN